MARIPFPKARILISWVSLKLNLPSVPRNSTAEYTTSQITSMRRRFTASVLLTAYLVRSVVRRAGRRLPCPSLSESNFLRCYISTKICSMTDPSLSRRCSKTKATSLILFPSLPPKLYISAQWQGSKEKG